MKVLGISGTIAGAKVAVLVQDVLNQIRLKDSNIEVELLDMKDYNVEFCDGRDPKTYTGDTKKVIDIIASADCYIIGTPISQGSITGVLKNLFDLVPVSKLRNKVMGFVAVGGTYQHYLVIENQLRPIASYFRAYVAPGFVYANPEHFNHKNEIIDKDILERINQLSKELVNMQSVLR